MAFSTFARFQLCAKDEQFKFEGKIEFLTHCSIAVAVKDLNQKTGPTKDYYAMFSVKSQEFFVLHKIGKKRDAEEAVGISKVVDLETCSVRTVNSKMTSSTHMTDMYAQDQFSCTELINSPCELFCSAANVLVTFAIIKLLERTRQSFDRYVIHKLCCQ